MVLSILALAFGFWMYSQLAPAWQQAQSFLGQLGAAFDPKYDNQVEDLRSRYYLSFGLMGVGGLGFLYGPLARR
jgi:hypothetical protein